jgi:PIN like domain
MRSERSSRPGEPEPPSVFIDRSLGKDIAAALREAGYEDVVHMADVYENDGQDVPDDTWIAYCGAQSRVAFSKDKNILSAHLDAVQQAGAILFLLPDQSMGGSQQIARYVEHRHRIAMKARKGGPKVYKVYARSVQQVWP